MVKLLEVSAGRIVLKDTTGRKAFDSDEKLFQAVHKLSGSVSQGPWVSQRFVAPGPAFVTEVHTNTNTTISAVNSACDTVVGAFRVETTSGTYGVQNLGWFQAGGTYIHCSEIADLGGFASTLGYNFAAFTFFASGGFLSLNTNVQMLPPSQGSVDITETIPAVTLYYHLYIGSFV